MSWIKKHEWIFSNLLTIILAVVVFYVSLQKLDNSLALSLFALFLIIFVGLIADFIDRKLKHRERNIWARAILLLFVVNIVIIFTRMIIFNGTLSDVLTFVIPYTLVILAITWFRSKLHEE